MHEPGPGQRLMGGVHHRGQSGYTEGGATNLVLTYRGRRTGKLYRTGLFFGEDNGRYILIASGSSITHTHPKWYLNVMANPEVRIQVLAEKINVRAYTAQGEERQRLWKLMTDLAPVYHTYEARTRRVIPVVVLERV
ncbi:nitroreductase/quinone reductase family protein [Streptomyces sp. DG2A-72]|uniref:nitroreductase/quinone reductase family protein n=1 Tax=Streptomyces sp. DG2A-72 TaxID=3051386 RepID=UPI00265C6EAB|nr:nitroreductase/quinone reductase family protein [Streptomyces sp. DG2A-72]MDO0939016.1 nitroreductase/quinone reductase family protein [Streptomyces sp. DG2A-72]